jgi:hypothetical protein
MVGPLAPTRYQFGYQFTSQQVIFIALLSFLIGLVAAFYGRLVGDMFMESKHDMIIRNITHNSPFESLSQLWTTQ